MTRPKAQTLRLLPSLVALAIAIMVIYATWVVPAQASSPKEVIEFGSMVGPIFFDGNTPQEKSFTWSYNLQIVGEEDEILVLPRLPYTNKVVGGSESGSGFMEIDLNILFNEEPVYRAVRRNTVEQGEPGNTSLRSIGAPGEVEQVNQEPLKSGNNVVTIRVDLRVGLHEKGSHDFYVTLGRPFMEVYKADSDKDGVVDEHQLTSVHSGLVAIPAAALAGITVWWGSARLLRRW